MMKIMKLTLVLCVLVMMAVSVTAELLFENSDFEKGTLENWKADGTAFTFQPTKGDNTKARGNTESKHQGNYWIGTYEKYDGEVGNPGEIQGDEARGTLTSKEFTISKRFINFLVGAGASKMTAVQLVVEGKTYFLGTGANNESMRQVSADVARFKGKKAKLILVDQSNGAWGHINVDNFTVSDKGLVKPVKVVEFAKAKIPGGGNRGPAKPLSGPEQSKTIQAEKNYLIIPIDNDGAKPQLSLKVDDKEVRFVTGPFAASKGDADWWAFLDISEYKGKAIDIYVSGLDDKGFALIDQADKVPGQKTWGSEPKRPQFHFSQKVGWNNDPNGMVYYKGEWHLYLQHNPVGLPWGNMTWAHGVSKDLCQWTQPVDALHHKRGDAMFSGGAVVDWKNTGGWKTGRNDVIIATWTSTGRGECVAYSNDKGLTFTEYEGNPVITHRGRDPKPIWYEYDKKDTPISDRAKKLGGHWVIAVYDEKEGVGRNIAFYTSTDLKKWDLQSNLPGYFECAELFELPVDGNKKNTRWAIFAADAKYAIGDFDGKKFTPEHEDKYQLHSGPYYASQCFSDAPDGRVIQIGWARIAMGDSCFNQTFTFPTELTLRKTADGIRMFGEPVEEIENIHGKKHKEKDEVLNDNTSVKIATKGALFDIRAVFEVGTAKELELLVDGNSVYSYNAESNVATGRQGIKPVDGKVSVQILIDRPMIEKFLNDGQAVITAPFENDLNIESVEAVAKGGEAKLVSLEVYELESKWMGNE